MRKIGGRCLMLEKVGYRVSRIRKLECGMRNAGNRERYKVEGIRLKA
jgi:hypothetical protein